MKLWLATLCLSAFAAAPLSAQTSPAPSPDMVQLTGCLNEQRSAPSACIGTVAISCVRAARSDPRGAEAGCARREEGLWRERLNLALQVAARPLDPGQRSRLAALQMSWESYVAQKCAFYATGQREPLQAGRQAGCQLREVAERAIEVVRALPRPAERTPSQRPEIFR